MEPDWNLISQIFGPAAPLLIATVWIARWYKPIYDRHVKAMERDIILRKHSIRTQKALAEFLKGQGHEIETPDLIDSFNGDGTTSG